MNITLFDILHTLDIAFTLVSVGLIDEARYTVTFKGGTCIICDTAHMMVGKACTEWTPTMLRACPPVSQMPPSA